MNTSDNLPMKVCVSVFGRFHAFYLAHQLHRQRSLHQLITTYPRFEVVKYGIPRGKISSLPLPGVAERVWQRMPARLSAAINPQFWLHQQFDQSAARHISSGADLYVGWSSYSEQGLVRARRDGAVTVVERGSSHIEYQRDVLREEYERHGLRAELPHPKIVEKECREYELADYISVPSGFARRTFMDKGFSEDRLIQVPYGVDLSAFHPLPRHSDVFRVVYAGAMSLRKGVHYLLQAFAELRLPKAELWLIGGRLDECAPFFSRYEGTFRYIGAVPQAKLREYYAQCSVFALCSIEDGFGMVLPQAMACGLPLICSSSTGGPDLIEDGREGFIVPTGDVVALKERLLFLYEHQEQAREMGRLAQEKVSRGLTWDDYGDNILGHYRRIVQQHRRRDRVA